MATMEKTWQFDTNRVHARCGAADTTNISAAWILWYLKAFLLGQIGGATQGLWSTYYSCDSVTAGTANDGVDRWGTTFDSTKVVMGTSTGSAKSWYVLKSPVLPNGMTVYLVIHATGTQFQGTVVNGCVQFYFSKAAPSGGTSTAGPTLPSDCWPLPVDKQYGTIQIIGNVQNPTANYDNGMPHHVHAGLTTDGSIFYLIGSKDSTGCAEFGFIFALLANTKANDQYPFWSMQSYQKVVNGAFDITNLSGWTTPSQTFVNTCRNAFGNMAAVTPMAIPYVGNYSILSTTVVSGIDPVDQSWFDFPCWVGFGGTTGGSGSGYQFKGRLQDFAMGPVQAGQGVVDALSGSITSMLLGALWVPSNTAPLL